MNELQMQDKGKTAGSKKERDQIVKTLKELKKIA